MSGGPVFKATRQGIKRQVEIGIGIARRENQRVLTLWYP